MKSVWIRRTGLGALAALTTLAPARGELRTDDLGHALVDISPEQELAVRRGLKWLADNQNADGSWTARIGFKLNNSYKYTSAGRGHVGVTALAGMAFLAGGYVPGRGKYGQEVDRCLNHVLACVQDDGYITYGGTRMYSHAFATLFLAEIYGMTHREDVRIKLQKSRRLHRQVPERPKAAGATFRSPASRTCRSSCARSSHCAPRATSASAFPKSTIDRAARYVVDSAVTKEHQHAASPHPTYRSEIGTFHYQKDSHSRSSFPLTAAGVTALHGLGIYSDELIRKGVDYLNKEIDPFNRRWGGRHGHYFFWYGHYYGVQAMYTQGGRDWENYFTKLRELPPGHAAARRFLAQQRRVRAPPTARRRPC